MPFCWLTKSGVTQEWDIRAPCRQAPQDTLLVVHTCWPLSEKNPELVVYTRWEPDGLIRPRGPPWPVLGDTGLPALVRVTQGVTSRLRAAASASGRPRHTR